MARKPVEQLKPFFPLLCLVLAWALIPIPLKKFFRSSLHEFQAPSWEAMSWARDLQNFWAHETKSKTELLEMNRDLARLNGAYRLQVMQNESLRQEVKRMENLLDLPSQTSYKYEVARVVHRQIGSWWHEMIVRKGRDNGILEGAGVVYAGGIVGKVRKVYSGTSIIRLVTSPSFRMVATFQGDTQPVYIQGWQQSGLGTPLGRVRNAPVSIRVSPQNPALLVSSRLGGVFPSGLPIGTVKVLGQASSGLSQEGPVNFPSDLFQLNEVAILVPLPASAME